MNVQAWDGWVYRRGFALLSLLAAVVLSIAILAMPLWVSRTAAELDHSALSLSLWGISAAFVHGLGYRPEMAIWRVLIGPELGWLLMVTGVTAWNW